MIRLRKITNVSKTLAMVNWRTLCSNVTDKLLDVTVDSEGIATLQMQRKPVNSLNLELLQSLHDSVCEIENKKCKGLILTSAHPTVFSAGADLWEFHKPVETRYIKYAEYLFDVVAKLFKTDLITTVAINGYTGAAACVLALPFEYRTMTTGKAVIGLNDTAVGIPPAKWIIGLMNRVMGTRNAEYALTTSFMYSAKQALQVGLVDEIATDKMDAVEKCKAFIKLHDNTASAVRATTKQWMRQEFINELEEKRDQHIKNFYETILSTQVQDNIDQFIKKLKQRKNSKI